MDKQHQNELVWVSMFNNMLATVTPGHYVHSASTVESIANATDAAYNELQKRRDAGKFGHQVTEQRGMEHAP